MKLLKIVGPSNSGKTTLVENLAARLAERGRVGTVKHLTCPPTLDAEGTDTARHRAAGAAETYGVQDGGDWFATGVDRDIDGLVADLAPRCDYLLVEGYSDVAIPTVALGGRDHAGEAIAAAPDADGVDVDALVETVEAMVPVESDDALD